MTSKSSVYVTSSIDEESCSGMLMRLVIVRTLIPQCTLILQMCGGKSGCWLLEEAFDRCIAFSTGV